MKERFKVQAYKQLKRVVRLLVLNGQRAERDKTDHSQTQPLAARPRYARQLKSNASAR